MCQAKAEKIESMPVHFGKQVKMSGDEVSNGEDEVETNDESLVVCALGGEQQIHEELDKEDKELEKGITKAAEHVKMYMVQCELVQEAVADGKYASNVGKP